MSIKSLMLTCGVLLMFSFYGHTAYGDTVDDEIEAAESMRVMAPLLEADQIEVPLLIEGEENPSPKLLSLPLEEKVQESLDPYKITSFMPAGEFNTLRDDYTTLLFAQKIGFTPNETGAPASKEVSWMVKIENFFKKIGSYYEKNGLWYQQMLY